MDSKVNANSRLSIVENGRPTAVKAQGMALITKIGIAVLGVVVVAGVISSVGMLGALLAEDNSNSVSGSDGQGGGEPLTTTSTACPGTSCTTRTTMAPTMAPTKGPTITTATPSTAAPTTTAPPVIDVRLPLHLLPNLYTVELQPFMYSGEPSTFTFNGSVKVDMTCMVDSNNITLHTNKLNISNIKVMDPAGNQAMYIGHSFDLERQFIVIETQPMTAGQNYSVEMTFVGKLTNDLAGLYLSTYQRGNESIYIATTQMQPTDARKTFPCFDEPAIKAEFDVTLVRKSHMISLSNMPVADTQSRYLATSLLAPIDARKVFPCFDEPGIKAYFDVTLVRKRQQVSMSNMPIYWSEERGDDWVADRFQTTAKMSTYLLAFIICDFNYTKDVTTNGVEYRAWARPEAVDQTPYSLSVGVEILTYFENYFNIPFPLPKQDMIAIPDFAAGAMENWGLITYRETAMLYEPGVSSEGNKQRVALVVSHELAHQWFGNLVTPSWWDDLWLNEGFASYVEYMGVDHVHPDWKMFEQFVVRDLQYVMNIDGLISSHPVYVPVSHPDEINEIFDTISYSKGATIIRMMRFFLGDKTFRKGLERYLTNLAYDAAFHDDLWFALGNQSVADGNSITNVKEIMDTWTLQMNFPTVNVVYNESGRVYLTQSRYLLDANATDPGKYTSPFGYRWEIPFTFTTSSEINFNKTERDIYMMTKESQIDTVSSPSIGAPAGNAWVLGNVNQYGYYRVNYDERNWDALISQLKTDHEAIVPINRAQIINDAWSLARSGDLKMTIALRTTEYLSEERENVPWSAASGELGFVGSMLERHYLYGAFSKFMQNITLATFQDIGMNNTGASHLESYIRSTITSLACGYGIAGCVDEAKRLFKEWMDNPDVNPIDPGLKSIVYCTAVEEGGVEEWDFAYEQYKKANLAAEKFRLLSSMACTKETWILSRYLDMSLNENEIRQQDSVSVIVAISWNTIGRPLAWDFFRSKWDYLLNDFGTGFFALTTLISGVTSSFNTAYDLAQLQDFMEDHPDMGSGERAFDQAVEKTKSNIKWMTDNVPAIEDWLAQQGFN